MEQKGKYLMEQEKAKYLGAHGFQEDKKPSGRTAVWKVSDGRALKAYFTERASNGV